MRQNKLDTSEEFEKLQEYQQSSKQLQFSDELPALQELVYSLLETYSFMARCTLILQKHEIDSLFSNYVQRGA